MKARVTSLLVAVGLLFTAGEALSARVKTPRLWGIAYGAFRDGQSPTDDYPSKQEIKEDMKILGDLTLRIRTYSVNQTQELIPRLARAAKLECYAGAHIGSDADANSREVEAVIRVGHSARPAGIVVGNEAIYHGTASPSDLIDLIRQVKNDEKIGRKGIPVGYAAAYPTVLDPPDGFAELIAELDFLMLNLHPYWAVPAVAIEDAAEWTYAAWLEIEEVRYPDKRVIIGETGWPAAGTRGDASPENQRRFLEDFARLALERNVPYFFFDAFDEKWKQDASGIEEEGHWGLAYSDRTLKELIADFFGSPPVLMEILRPARCGAGPKRTRKIGGQVHGVARSELGDYRVVIYAGTNQWYVQPLLTDPLTRIRGSLKWSNKTHLGEAYAALLVREGYVPADTLPFREWPPHLVPPPLQPSKLLPPLGADVVATAVRDCK